jgi:hypothetical protein
VLLALRPPPPCSAVALALFDPHPPIAWGGGGGGGGGRGRLPPGKRAHVALPFVQNLSSLALSWQ